METPAPRHCPPCVLHEDEHLLVVGKPSGWNTHAPAPHAGEGIYEWLRDREPRWASLAIVHRLDRETSGVLVFSLTTAASRSLTAQFAARRVRKRYVLLTDRPAPRQPLRVVTGIARAGDRYVTRPPGPGSDEAITVFTPWDQGPTPSPARVIAEPLTGRSHQIRVHAAERGFPVLGDVLYGGTPAARLCLHAERIEFRHPGSGEPVWFESAADFDADTRVALRATFVDPRDTDAYRLVHGAADGVPGWYLDRLGEYALSASEQDADPAPAALPHPLAARARYHKRLSRRLRELSPAEVSPALVRGEAAPDRFVVRENGVRFELSLGEGYSVGLFLDQRDNRRRLLVNHVAAGFAVFTDGAAGRGVLNAFAYTCGFSVCAALAGATVTSLDLSRKYLDWGRRNFELNGLDPSAHDFIYGDAFDWLRRLTRKGRVFEAILLDPPTFSQSKESGAFRAERDYGRLLDAALPLLARGGLLFTSTNAARLAPESFMETVRAGVAGAGRRILGEHYAPQPPDFPVTREEPGHLKSAWFRIG